jgi:protein-tyrosine phosphatase
VIDIHCHILPGLDDGAKDLEHSLEMARIAVLDGISGIVCTPHMSPHYPGNNRDVVLAAVDELRTGLAEEGIELALYPGCELAMDSDLPERIEAGELLTFNDNGNAALVEMPLEMIPTHMSTFLWKMQVRGITPILAHPERNRYLVHNPSILLGWVEAGALVQVTGNSLRGHYGERVRDFSLKLLEHKAAHLVASDSHSADRRRPVLSKAREIVDATVGAEEARKIFDEYPAEILDGRIPDVESVIPLEKEKKSFIRRIMGRLELI